MINSRGLFSRCELRLYFPFDVQRQFSEWIKLATTDFRIVWAENPRNLHDVAPLTFLCRVFRNFSAKPTTSSPNS